MINLVKLCDLIKYAYDNVPYYTKTIREDVIEDMYSNLNAIENIPYINKQRIRDNYDQFFSKEINSSNLIWEYTSGTSGTPLRVGKTQSERTRKAINLMKWRKDNFQISIGDKYAFFTSIGTEKKVIIDKNVIYLSEIYLDDNTLFMYYNIMKNKNIKWIYSTPAVTYVLMNFMLRYNLSPIESVKYIELSGEQILKEEKIRLGNFFRCRVAEQYGTIELWSIAQECSHGKLHVMENDVYLEIIDGESYITALGQYAFPIIRYNVDDELEYDTPCECGLCSKTIKIIKSRSKEFLYIGKDTILSPILLNVAINKLMDNPNIRIEQFIYIQHSYDSLTCYIVYTNSNYSVEIIKELLLIHLNKFYKIPDSFNFEVVRLESLIQLMKKGKLGYFKSDLSGK